MASPVVALDGTSENRQVHRGHARCIKEGAVWVDLMERMYVLFFQREAMPGDGGKGR
jgi:hypothetical protein